MQAKVIGRRLAFSGGCDRGKRLVSQGGLLALRGERVRATRRIDIGVTCHSNRRRTVSLR